MDALSPVFSVREQKWNTVDLGSQPAHHGTALSWETSCNHKNSCPDTAHCHLLSTFLTVPAILVACIEYSSCNHDFSPNGCSFVMCKQWSELYGASSLLSPETIRIMAPNGSHTICKSTGHRQRLYRVFQKVVYSVWGMIEKVKGNNFYVQPSYCTGCFKGHLQRLRDDKGGHEEQFLCDNQLYSVSNGRLQRLRDDRGDQEEQFFMCQKSCRSTVFPLGRGQWQMELVIIKSHLHEKWINTFHLETMLKVSTVGLSTEICVYY